MRLALENLAAHELAVSSAELLAHARIAEQAIGAMPDLEVSNLPATLTNAIDRATSALIDEIGTSSPDDRRIRDSYLGFSRQVQTPDPMA